MVDIDAVHKKIRKRVTNLTPYEHDEQVMFVTWFKCTFKNIKILAIPNGGSRNKIEAAKLKAEGVSKGVPDLYIPELCLWVEMKRKKGGYLSAEQKEWKSYLEEIGHKFIIGYGHHDAKKKVLEFLENKNDTSQRDKKKIIFDGDEL